MAAPSWVFSMFAFIGFACVTVPLPWHMESWNVGTCMYMIWTGLACLNLFINSVVWSHDVLDKAPVWCDISTRFMIGAAVAIPAASLCINRRLYHIASVSTVMKTRAQRRRDIMVDLSIGLGIPILEMVLQYIVQGHRFNIYEEVGCYPFTYNTPPAYPLVFAWPVAIGCVSAVYCALTIRELAQRRAQFKELLSANQNLSSGRYFRLMGLAGVEILGTVPIGCYSIYLNASAEQIEPWISWENVHSNFSRVRQYPSIIWRSSTLGENSIELSRWIVIVCALIFFAFFGFADEARKHYKIALTSAAKTLGVSTASWGNDFDMTYDSKNGTVPAFTTTKTARRGTRASMASFGSDIYLGDVGGYLDSDVKKGLPPFSPTTTTAAVSKESLGLPPMSPLTPSVPEPSLDMSHPPRYETAASSSELQPATASTSRRESSIPSGSGAVTPVGVAL